MKYDYIKHNYKHVTTSYAVESEIPTSSKKILGDSHCRSNNAGVDKEAGQGSALMEMKLGEVQPSNVVKCNFAASTNEKETILHFLLR